MIQTFPRPATLCAPLLVAVAAAGLGLAVPAAAGGQEAGERKVERREIVVVRPGSGPALVHERLARRGFLGVHLVDLTPELRAHFGAPRDRGVMVGRVEEDSPAAAAGIRVGDLIAAVDGKPIAGSIQLMARIGPRHRGEEIALEIWRDGARLEVRAELAESERQQVELGQFLWRDEESEGEVLRIVPGATGKVIALDPESIDRSVRELLDRLEVRRLAGAGLDSEQRRELERRIEMLEERLREMERRLERRRPGDG